MGDAKKLLGCPFCGSPGKLYGTQCDGYLHCSNDNCPVQPSAFNKKAGSDILAAWNTRAPITAQGALAVPEIAALVEAAKLAMDYAVADEMDEWFAAMKSALAGLDNKA